MKYQTYSIHAEEDAIYGYEKLNQQSWALCYVQINDQLSL